MKRYCLLVSLTDSAPQATMVVTAPTRAAAYGVAESRGYVVWGTV